MSTRVQTPAPVRSKQARGTKKSVRSQVNLFNGMGHLALLLWAVLVIVPIIWVFLASFKNTTEIFSSPWTLPAELRWENYSRAWTTARVGTYFLNSVWVVGWSTFGTMLLGSMAAYVLARYEFWGRRALYFLFVAGMAFPTFLAIVPLFFVVDQLGLLNTYTGLILVYISYSLPFTVFFLCAFFRTLPTSVAEAGIIDGCSHTKLFFKVMLPMAKPGMISVAIFNIIGQWAQYLLPLVLVAGDKDKWVLTQGIKAISIDAGYAADWSGLFAALTISILPMIIVYGIFQRQIQSGLTAGAVK